MEYLPRPGVLTRDWVQGEGNPEERVAAGEELGTRVHTRHRRRTQDTGGAHKTQVSCREGVTQDAHTDIAKEALVS